MYVVVNIINHYTTAVCNLCLRYESYFTKIFQIVIYALV
jgi:hypothetical protein